LKIEAGADFVITQLFFDNKDYFEYIDRLRRSGVNVRVIPGIHFYCLNKLHPTDEILKAVR